VLLNDGHSMPAVSLGTCCGQAGDLGVKAWLVAGGEGIDTAIGYGSEDGIAEVLRSMRPAPDRSALFITTKIHAGSGSLSDCSADPGSPLRSSVPEELERGVYRSSAAAPPMPTGRTELPMEPPRAARVRPAVRV
jgi:hypothetical protein